MALLMTREVTWDVHRIDSGGAVGKWLGCFTFPDNEKRAQQWAEQNKKHLWSLNKKSKVKVFRRPR